MKKLLIENLQSGKAKQQSIAMERLMAECQWRIAMSREIDLFHEVCQAVDQGCELVVAAGGDGTVNAVVNALMQVDAERRPRLAILPLGTANDFAGTLCIPDDLSQAIALLETDQVLPVDVVSMQSSGFQRYFANIAAGGNSVRVSEEMTDEMKESWGAFCYLRGGVEVLSDLTSFHIDAQCDDELFSELDTWAVLVANGKTNAGRIVVAPEASPVDGLLDVIIIRDGTVFDMVEIVARALLGSYLDSDQVIHRQVKMLKLRSQPAMRFTIDGEVVDQEPVQFDVVPAAISMVVGSQFLIENSNRLATANEIDCHQNSQQQDNQ